MIGLDEVRARVAATLWLGLVKAVWLVNARCWLWLLLGAIQVRMWTRRVEGFARLQLDGLLERKP